MIYIDKCERIFPRKITCVLMEIHRDTSSDNSKRLPESDRKRKKWKKIMSCDMQTKCYSCSMYTRVCIFFSRLVSRWWLCCFIHFLFHILLSTLKYTRIDFAMSLFLSNLLFHCYLRQIRWEKRRRRRRHHKESNGTPKILKETSGSLFLSSRFGISCKLNCRVHSSSSSIDFSFSYFCFGSENPALFICIHRMVLCFEWEVEVETWHGM